MRFQILNNEQIGFYNESGNLTSIIQPSGSNLIINPISPDGNIELGQNGVVNDVELGNLSTPVDMTFLGGGTITSNGNTLYIGNSNLGDSIIINNLTLPTSDPGVTGRLFRTSSEAIGASAGFQVVCISQG
jgi:hypothetical protein